MEAVCPVELAQTTAGAVMAGVLGQPTTSTATLLLLLPVLVSGVVVLAVAVFVTVVPLEGAVTSIEIGDACAPAPRGPIVHVRVLVPLHVQFVAEMPVTVRPAGSGSTTVTSCVAPLPPLTTAMV